MIDDTIIFKLFIILVSAIFMAVATLSTDWLDDLVMKLWHKVSGKTRRQNERLRADKVRNMVNQARQELKK